jgi:hypothetical protein
MDSPIIGVLLDNVRNEFEKAEPQWENIHIEPTDMDFLKAECDKPSEFDPHNNRKKMLDKFSNNTADGIFIKCEYGTLYTIFENIGQLAEMPWGLWARILRMYSENKKKPFKVFLLATQDLRQFPEDKEAHIRPENINGGYTYRCNHETIIIYRAEDATRVLIHELMHSCCLDNPENSVDDIEAETEAWAELIYIGILSRGKQFIFNDLLQRQSEWMRKQNTKIRKHMKDPQSMEFPWRYTIGKEDVWKRWGILKTVDMPPFIKVGKSLRLTYPPSNTLKDYFRVSRNSTIL